jgi:hypothetical protein
VGPVLPALQVLTPFIFSTFAEIIFKSVEQVMPLTFVDIVFVESDTCSFSDTDCAKVVAVEAKTKVIAKTNIFENFIFLF